MFNRKAPKSPLRNDPVLACSFCNKTQDQVNKLIAGPTVFICDECIRVCVDIIEGEREGRAPADSVSEAAADVTELPDLAPLAMPCGLCHLITTSDDLLIVHDRGGLCRGCVAAIEAALAADQPASPPGRVDR